MIDQSTLLTYLIVLLGFVFIPGPAVLLTLARATSGGTRVGIATGFGIAVGDVIHTVLAVVGISAVMMASALMFTVIKYLGAAYLVYLGIRAIVEKADVQQSHVSRKLTPVAAFRQAVLAEVLNPKSAMFFLAFLPQFVNPANGLLSLQLLALGILFVLTGLLSTVTVALCAGRVGHYLGRHPAFIRWQGKVVGSIYCALGVRLAIEER